MKQKGFLHIGIVIAIVVVVIGGATAIVLSRSSDTDDSAQSTQDTVQPNDESSESTETSEQAESEDQANTEGEDVQETANESSQNEDTFYLEIPEWGVRFQLTEEFQGDISYELDLMPYQRWGGPIVVELFSKRVESLSAQDEFKSCTHPSGKGAEILSLDQDLGQTTFPEAFKQIGEAYYYFGRPGCQQAIVAESANSETEYIERLQLIIKDTLEVIDPNAYEDFKESIN